MVDVLSSFVFRLSSRTLDRCAEERVRTNAGAFFLVQSPPSSATRFQPHNQPYTAWWCCSRFPPVNSIMFVAAESLSVQRQTVRQTIWGHPATAKVIFNNWMKKEKRKKPQRQHAVHFLSIRTDRLSELRWVNFSFITWASIFERNNAHSSRTLRQTSFHDGKPLLTLHTNHFPSPPPPVKKIFQ